MAPSIADLPRNVPAVPSKVVAAQNEHVSSAMTSRVHLETSIKDHDLAALWNVNATQDEPRTKHIPAVWRYNDTKALLLKAGELVPASEAERRALIMINPGPRSPPHTLDTILSAHQLLLPGETALCHRHTPFAVRFLIEGQSGYTAIAGKKMYMEPGDMIITPQWAWHDHGNDGSDNVIWLDGLNIPFFKLNPVDFLELHEDKVGTVTHESRRVPDDECADMKFPWKTTKARLDAATGDHAVHEYRLPDGRHVNHIMAASAEKIAPGTTTAPRQDTANRIYQVHAGTGTAVITAPRGGPSYELSFSHADTFAVPSWYSFVISADPAIDEPVYLFSFSDKAMLENLNIYRQKEDEVVS